MQSLFQRRKRLRQGIKGRYSWVAEQRICPGWSGLWSCISSGTICLCRHRTPRIMAQMFHSNTCSKLSHSLRYLRYSGMIWCQPFCLTEDVLSANCTRQKLSLTCNAASVQSQQSLWWLWWYHNYHSCTGAGRVHQHVRVELPYL